MTLNEILWGNVDNLGAFELIGILVVIAVVCYVIYKVVEYIYDNIYRLYQYTAKCTCKDCKYRNRDEFCLKFKCVMPTNGYCFLAEKKDFDDSIIDCAETIIEVERYLNKNSL